MQLKDYIDRPERIEPELLKLYDRLSNFAGLTALVSDRIYPQRATSDALPYVVFDVIDREASYDQAGYADYNKLLVEISSCGVLIAQCDSVAKQVFAALNIINTQIGAVGDKEELCATYLLSESNNFFLFDGSQDGVREITQTYQITYLEA